MTSTKFYEQGEQRLGTAYESYLGANPNVAAQSRNERWSDALGYSYYGTGAGRDDYRGIAPYQAVWPTDNHRFTGSRSRKPMKKKCWVVCGALLMAGATACGSGDDGSAAKNPPAESSSEICDGTLAGAGASTLRKMADTDRYWERGGSSDPDGNPYKFSLKSAAEDLRREGAAAGDCRIYLEDVDKPLIIIRFDSLPAATDLSDAEKTDDPTGAFTTLWARSHPRTEDSRLPCTSRAPG
ncbi:hypothetical protein ACFYPN_05070 [Streptomyces sp. NPDC005576]|uniref:hypothetical protein n=1 Tax=Streptomyces sp. NPDC005576 TaxID=3364726 RepID=UPI0036813F1C